MSTTGPIDDFYDRLVRLTSREALVPLLDEALRLIVELTAADLALLEIYDDHASPQFSRGHHCNGADVATIRGSVSSRIIRRAMATRQTITTSSAELDDRFADLGSVRQCAIQAVVCVPIGTREAGGVIYLQGIAGAFGDADPKRVETFARAIAPLVEQLIPRVSRPTLAQQIQELKRTQVRDAMARNGDNVSKAARELGVSRAVVYRARRKPKDEAGA